MLKKICKSIALIIIVISIALVVQHLKKSHLKGLIKKKINSQIGIKYNISDNIKRCVSNGHMSCDSEKMPSCFKLVYEMDFGCSRCLMDLKEIYNFYIKLSNIREIEFCLITTIKSYSYIEFYLKQSLENYNLWVAQQKVIDDNIKLYLIGTLNNIVMAGDITIYPFLKDEYIRKFKNEK